MMESEGKPIRTGGGTYPVRSTAPPPSGASLVDVLDRVLDKGIVIAGDITVSLVNVELLSIKLRLLITSVDKAEEIGLDWWRTDPYFSSKAPHKTSTLEKVKTAATVAEKAVNVFGGGDKDDSDKPSLPGRVADAADKAEDIGDWYKSNIQELKDELASLRREQSDWIENMSSRFDSFLERNSLKPGQIGEKIADVPAKVADEVKDIPAETKGVMGRAKEKVKDKIEDIKDKFSAEDDLDAV